MKTTLTTLQAFEQTTVNVNGVKDYFKDIPPYFEAGLRVGASRGALEILNYTDFFEYHFRRYLSGRTKTLRGVFREIRDFQQVNKRQALFMVAYSMAVVKETILLNVWYELMPRYQQARQRIEYQFQVDPLFEEKGFDLSSSIYLANRNTSHTES